MAAAPFHRASGRHKRLSQHLSAENALHAVLGTLAAENVLFDLLQVEQLEDFLNRRIRVHVASLNHALGPAQAAPPLIPFARIVHTL